MHTVGDERPVMPMRASFPPGPIGGSDSQVDDGARVDTRVGSITEVCTWIVVDAAEGFV
jgi:hypothetical protein